MHLPTGDRTHVILRKYVQHSLPAKFLRDSRTHLAIINFTSINYFGGEKSSLKTNTIFLKFWCILC